MSVESLTYKNVTFFTNVKYINAFYSMGELTINNVTIDQLY